MKDDRCCTGECRQGRDCPLCNTASLAAYIIVVVIMTICAFGFVHWINRAS